MCSCYVLKKTSRASVFEAMHCTAHDLCDDSESRVRFHKRKEDLWNSEVWCSPFAPALWLWSCVSAFSPPRFTSKSIPSCVMQAHVRSCAGAFFEVPAFFASFHLVLECRNAARLRASAPRRFFPPRPENLPCFCKNAAPQGEPRGTGGDYLPRRGQGAAPLCLFCLSCLFCLFFSHDRGAGGMVHGDTRRSARRDRRRFFRGGAGRNT